MKTFRILLVSFLAITLMSASCSADEEALNGNLNIPEVFVVEGRTVQTDAYVKVTQNSVIAETTEGRKTITQGNSEFFNGEEYYEVYFDDGYKLVLVMNEPLVGVSIRNDEGVLIINDFVER